MSYSRNGMNVRVLRANLTYNLNVSHIAVEHVGWKYGSGIRFRFSLEVRKRADTTPLRKVRGDVLYNVNHYPKCSDAA